MNGKMAPDLRGYYERTKQAFLSDPDICPENRELFTEFFAFEEHKLKRVNGLPDIDNGCCKTLLGYITRMSNVNLWFQNKPWRDLTKEDIQRVYDDLEEGRIKRRDGQPFQDRSSYYNKIFKSKPFRLAGKDGLAKDVIEFSTNSPKIVRYVTEESFRRLVSVVRNPVHQLLLWLAWDIGENIQTLLALTREDFISQVNRHSGEREYIVNLPASKLKRSRLSRSEVTLYPETARWLDLVLPSAPLNDGYLFNSGYRAAAKMLAKAVATSGATSMPHGDPLRWKDLRSGMACHLLRAGWTRDEVNARLGQPIRRDTRSTRPANHRKSLPNQTLGPVAELADAADLTPAWRLNESICCQSCPPCCWISNQLTDHSAQSRDFSVESVQIAC